ncbi:hypothetical protein [Paraburkholderia susongensis]|nr:hypothetical protein [Paraburkholderia susongensis]
MLTVYDDVDVLVLDPVADEALVPDAGAVDAEPEVDAVDEGAACTML